VKAVMVFKSKPKIFKPCNNYYGKYDVEAGGIGLVTSAKDDMEVVEVVDLVELVYTQKLT
jgi:hypothetical protein